MLLCNAKNVPFPDVSTAIQSALVLPVILRMITSQMGHHASNVLWSDVATVNLQQYAIHAIKPQITSTYQMSAPYAH